MEFLKEALNALPSVATNPLAFAGYLVTILAWVWAVNRSRRLRLLLERLREIPEADRAAIIRHEMGAVLPENISAEQWIRSTKHWYYFLAFVLLLLTLLSVVAISAWKGSTVADRPVQLHVTLEDIFDKLKAHDASFERDPRVARTFWLLREPGASIALGTCPGPECVQFILGSLRTAGGNLVQQIFLSGSGSGIQFHPDPKTIYRMDGGIHVKGSHLQVDLKKKEASAELVLARGNVFEMSTKVADISLKVLDTRTDSLRIHLEVRHGTGGFLKPQ
jgi:hypothetical protein